MFVDGLGVIERATGPQQKLERAKWAGKKKRAMDLKKGLAKIRSDLVLLMSSGIL
jgi:hypothetical protein